MLDIEEKAIQLIDNAMIRLKNSIHDDIQSRLLQSVYTEQNLLRKIENLIHILVISNQKQDNNIIEMYNSIKSYFPNAPSNPQILSQWLLSYIQFQENEIQNFHNQLNQIHESIQDISNKINNSVFTSKNNSLIEENKKLKEKIHKFEEKDCQIAKIQAELQMCHNERDNYIAENNKLKSKITELQSINQKFELIEQNKENQSQKEKDLKQKMQFQVDMLTEKCSIMKNDLSFALKQNIELNNAICLLKEEIQQKKAELISLKSIIKDYKITGF